MNYYLLTKDVEHYYWLEKNDGGNIDLDFIPGKSYKNTLSKLKLRLIYEDDEKNQLKGIGDIPNYQNKLNLLIISEKAYKILIPYIKENIEVINVEIEDVKTKYYCINVLRIENCLDLNNSIFDWLEENEIILDYEKYVFDEKKITSEIFRLKYDERHIFISEKLKKEIENNNLEGFKFQNIYDGSPKV